MASVVVEFGAVEQLRVAAPFRDRVRREVLQKIDLYSDNFSPLRRMTSAHFSRLVRMISTTASGPSPRGSNRIAAMRLLTSGVLTTSAAKRPIFSTIGFGVPAGANRPRQLSTRKSAMP